MKQLYLQMKPIKYGILTKSGKIILGYNISETNYANDYILQTPQEVLTNKVGVCWDQTELERKYCEDNNIPHKCYYAQVNEIDNTHTFLTFKHDSELYYFEHSWESYKGIHGPIKSVDVILNDMMIKTIKYHNSHPLEPKINRFRVFEYPKPKKFHIDCDTFMNWCKTKGKCIKDITL